MSLLLVSQGDGVGRGGEIAVGINVEPNGRGISGATVGIAYDPGVLQVVGTQVGGLLAPDAWEAPPSIDQGQGLVDYSAVRLGPTTPPTPPGLLGIVVFRLLDGAPAETVLRLAGATVADHAQQSIDVTLGPELPVGPLP